MSNDPEPRVYTGVPFRLLPGQHVLIHDISENEWLTGTDWLLAEMPPVQRTRGMRAGRRLRIIVTWHGTLAATEPDGPIIEFELDDASGRFEAIPISDEVAGQLVMLAAHCPKPDARAPVEFRRKCYEIAGVEPHESAFL